MTSFTVNVTDGLTLSDVLTNAHKGAEIVQTLSLSATAYLVATPTFEDTINVILRPEPTPTITFSWSPQGGQFSYVAGLTTYIPAGINYTPTGVPITFVASTIFPVPNVGATEYYWDFGDGVIGYGQTVTHTYIVANPQTQVILRVTDTRGKRAYTRQQLYLQSVMIPDAGPGAALATA